MQDTTSKTSDISSSNASGSWLEDILKAFSALIVKSPIALLILVFSFFQGYGLSFFIFDYANKDSVPKSHTYLNIVVGLAYMTCIFVICNFDIMSREMTEKVIMTRIPFTFVISFATFFVAFLVIIFFKLRKS